MRQVVLDTETTGLEHRDGHRIVEIGCVEMVERRLTGRNFHVYLNPERQVEGGALEVHGITDDFLADKPKFVDIAKEFIGFIRDAELVIHNASFDVGFLNAELERLGDESVGRVEAVASVLDTLALARELHPGQRNSLDALCRRYQIDNSSREYHGALLDAEILCDVYLAMTGGQAALSLDHNDPDATGSGRRTAPRRIPDQRPPLNVIRPNTAEQEAHEVWLQRLDKAVDGPCLWRQLERDSG